MLAYIILFVLLGLVFIIPKRYFEKYGIVLLMIIFAIFFGIRNDVAVDDFNYINMFSVFSKSLKNATLICPDVEMIFKIICRILGILHLNYKFLFLLYSSLSFTFLGLFLKKIKLDKKELFIFIIAFLAIAFFTYMTIMRQFLAISIALYGMALVAIDKKYKSGIALMIISILFHSSTIIMLIFLPLFLSKTKIDYKIKIILLIIIVILGEFGWLNELVEILSSNLKYGKYTMDEADKVFGGSGILHYVFLVIYILQCFMSNKNEENKQNQEEINEFMKNGEFIYLLLFFSTVNSGFAIRLSYLYLIFLCLLFITFVRKIKNKKSLVVIGICILLIVIMGKNMTDNENTKFMQNNFSVDFFNENKIY